MKKQTKEKPFYMRMPLELYKQLSNYSIETGKSKSQVIQELISKYAVGKKKRTASKKPKKEMKEDITQEVEQNVS